MKAPRSPVKLYVTIWIALLVLLYISFGAAEFDLGPMNTPVALGISAVKMLLVVLIFMHVRWEPRITWVFVAGGLVWFLIMAYLTLGDYTSRGDSPDRPQKWGHHDVAMPPPR